MPMSVAAGVPEETTTLGGAPRHSRGWGTVSAASKPDHEWWESHLENRGLSP